MKIIGHNITRQHRYRPPGQVKVHRAHNGARVKSAVQIKMRGHCHRMNAGVRAARRNNVRAGATERLYGVFHNGLHGRALAVFLPPDKARAVIFQNHPISCHQRECPPNFLCQANRLHVSCGRTGRKPKNV